MQVSLSGGGKGIVADGFTFYCWLTDVIESSSELYILIMVRQHWPAHTLSAQLTS